MPKQKRVSCPCCEIARINGALCHETGCRNTKARYDHESGEWIHYWTCRECGDSVPEGVYCNCNEPEQSQYIALSLSCDLCGAMDSSECTCMEESE